MEETQNNEIEGHIGGVINSPELSEEQRQVMRTFDAAKKANGVSVQGRRTYIYFLRELALVARKPFEQCTKEDIAAYINSKGEGQIRVLDNGRGRTITIKSKVTSFKARVHCKLFFKWLNGGTLPASVSWIERRKPNISKRPEDMLNHGELEQIYGGCTEWRHAAMLHLLYETGTRSGEFRNIRIGDIELEAKFARIGVDGKTGERTVFVAQELPFLMQLIKHHPAKNDSNAPIFYVLRKSAITPYSQRGLDEIIRRSAERIGFKKRVYPHLFRFSRATELASKMSESEMRLFFGWTKNSTMPQHYVNLSQRHVENKYLQINGIRPKEDAPQEKMGCRVCGKEIAATEDYCPWCHTPLGVVGATRDSQKREKVESAILELLRSNPEMAKGLANILNPSKGESL